MKKLLAGLVAASMLVSPAMAHDREHRESRSGCGWLCGAIIGGLLVGAINSDREDRRSREYDNRYYPPDSRYDERYCVREQIVEWRYGERYVYWRTTCN